MWFSPVENVVRSNCYPFLVWNDLFFFFHLDVIYSLSDIHHLDLIVFLPKFLDHTVDKQFPVIYSILFPSQLFWDFGIFKSLLLVNLMHNLLLQLQIHFQRNKRIRREFDRDNFFLDFFLLDFHHRFFHTISSTSPCLPMQFFWLPENRPLLRRLLPLLLRISTLICCSQARSLSLLVIIQD